MNDMTLTWVEESNGDLFESASKKRKSKKLRFAGWGSVPLINFLHSIGKDTNNALSQSEVASIVDQYIKQNNLIDLAKKKRVNCDERLKDLFFNKRFVNRLKIFQLLEEHFSENQVESDDDLFNTSEDEDEDLQRSCKQQKLSSTDKKSRKEKEEAAEALKHLLAAIIPENIKLVYLKRSLILDLLKDSVTLESKLIGSFVKVKPDPLDYSQRRSQQLHLVTGTKQAGDAGGSNSELLLEVANIPESVSMSRLSDESVTKEDCEDLCKRMKEGLLKQPTVGELERRAQVLHEDITNHWLVRELAVLQNLIDRANERGWRGELAEHRERRKLLLSPEEKSRLLQERPEVIAEELKLEPVANSPAEMNEAQYNSPRSVDWAASVEPAGGKLDQTSDSPGVKGYIMPDVLPFNRMPKLEKSPNMKVESNSKLDSPTLQESSVEQLAEVDNGQIESNGQLELSVPKENGSENATKMNGKQTEVIDLSDDDSNVDNDDGSLSFSEKVLNGVLPDQEVWYYMDPQNQVQGPFSGETLKRWWNLAEYFSTDFKVWKNGYTSEQSALLREILQQMFPDEGI